MAAANWFRYAKLAYFSRPKGNRELYRLVKRSGLCRIVEIGMSDLSRTVGLIEVAQRFASDNKVWYTGFDWFEARQPGSPRLLLKETYRLLRATGAIVRLVPGAPAPSLAAAANAHQNTDLILLGPDVGEEDIQNAWFYVPRMLNDNSVVLNEQRMSDGQPIFTAITRSQIAEWAAQKSTSTRRGVSSQAA
ncbi:MAG TPA: hypothetical protein VHE81_01580 [Lacipirellulaceae bacterium]|nr:hypothetical protein [Lacipirellulaceae bacterium]